MTSDRRRVLVVGASGFIGRGVVSALSSAGHTVSTLPGPRLAPMPASAAASFIASSPLVHELASTFSDVDAVVNAAGNPDASETHADALISPNAVLPGLLAAACRAADPSPRLVHISSAVVQGRASELDASRRTEAFSGYARSKILGETLALQHAPESTVVYRPPSVHALDRRVTRMIGAVARSPLATVARPGSSPSPQALLPNVASAIAFLATCPQPPPAVVTHPSEGLTTSSLMRALGGRRPRELPRWLARAGVVAVSAAGKLSPGLAANARRVELLWFGQSQAPSWLTQAGWAAPFGAEAWARLGLQLQSGQTAVQPREGAE